MCARGRLQWNALEVCMCWSRLDLFAIGSVCKFEVSDSVF